MSADCGIALPDDEIDKWMKGELELARLEFVDRLEILIEQYSKRKFGKLGEHISREIVVKVGIEVT